MIACGEDGPLPLRAAGMGLAVERLRWLRSAPSPHADVLALAEIENLIRLTQPDVVHTHSSKAGVLGRLAASKVLLSSGVRPAVVHHCHGLAWGMGAHSGFAGEFYRRIERATGHLCDGVISVSNAVQQQLLADGTYPAAQHVVIHNGIDLGRAGHGPFTATSEQRRLLGLPTAGPLVAHVGRVIKSKGQELAIAATRLLVAAGSDVNLLIIGDGPVLHDLRDQTAQVGELSNQVHFLGFRTDVGVVLRSCDLLCLPSATEGFPLAVIEAMAASLPVVATSVGGVPELVVAHETGVLLDRNATAAHLAEAIGSLLKDHARAQAMGHAGRERAERLYSLRNSECTVDFLFAMIRAARTAA